MGSTDSFKPLADTALFKPLELGALKLEHRMVLAPLTRMRGSKESEGVFVPSDLHVQYYSQRASKGGFLLTEACPISRLVRLPLFFFSQPKIKYSMSYRQQATRAFQESSPPTRSKLGRKLQMPFTSRGHSYIANYGT